MSVAVQLASFLTNFHGFFASTMGSILTLLSTPIDVTAQEVEVEVNLGNDSGLKSSDIFGSFEDGLTADIQDDDAWGASAMPPDADIGRDAWGSPWGASSGREDPEPPKDEWEAAREEK